MTPLAWPCRAPSTPQRQADYTELQGQADLQIHLELPPPIRFLPASVLDRTGRTFLSGILGTIKHRIERQLVEDYRAWVATTHRRPQVGPQEAMQGRTVQG
jgi:hypothetical protein